MRLYSRDEFEAELRERGLEPTDITTKTGRLWRTRDGKVIISVPNPSPTTGKYPDSILDRLLEQLKKLYEPPEGSN